VDSDLANIVQMVLRKEPERRTQALLEKAGKALGK